MSETRAWLALTVTERRRHGGNDGYDDVPDVYYSWDDTVPHHGNVQVGDIIVLWNKKELIGLSVIEEITRDTEVKFVYRCPYCSKGNGIQTRQTKRPKYTCYRCKSEFDQPTVHEKEVQTFRSRHDTGWLELPGCLSGSELRNLCVNPKSQHSFRLLDWAAFTAAITAKAGVLATPILNSVRDHVVGGHKERTVRARIGQATFRRRLLELHGAVCAFSGPTPIPALEAAHLYSYAAVGQHHERGGLLLRRDIHRLFDLGELTVHPGKQVIDVAPLTATYPSYARLHGQSLYAPLDPIHIEWLTKHWDLHRERSQNK
ncbi:hypothetical protein GCM10023347_08210 [Streptomyces chumphonensis]